MQLNTFSLKLKFNLALIALVIFVTASLTLVVVVQVINQTERDYTQSIDQQIKLVDQSIFKYADNVASNTKMLAEMPIIKDADNRITTYVNAKTTTGKTEMKPLESNPYEVAVYGLLKAFQTSHPSVKNASLGVEVNGGFVKSPPSDRFDGYDAREREWYKKALASPGEVVISEIYTTSSNEKVLLCVTTVANAEHKIVGVITVDFDLKDLSEVISTVKIGQSGYMILTDAQGLVIAHPKDPNKIGLSLADIGLGHFIENSRVAETTKIIRENDGKQFLTISVASELTSFPLNYIVMIEQSEFYQSAFEVLIRIGLLVILLLMGAIVISYFVSSRLSKPLEELNQYVDILASGALDTRLELNRFDEIGTLAQKFNFMAESLERSQNHLEETVKERTIAYETANAFLLDTNSELTKTLDLLQTTQQQLIQSEKMAGLSTLVAGVAHEINTPLGVAISAASLTESLLEGIQKDLLRGNIDEMQMHSFTNKCGKSIEILTRNLERTSNLVEHFKQVSVDQSSETPRRFKVKNYVEDLLIGFTSTLIDRGHRLIITCDEQLELYSFPGTLSQIITHLMINTLEHGLRKDGKGIVSLDFIEVNGTVVFKFSDNGSGMSDATQSKAFEPFFTTNRSHGGTGLGLHIVYNLVTLQLAGDIRLTSILDQGTEFTITIPNTITD